MENQVRIEGRLDGVVPSAVYRVGSQLRVEAKVVHHNEYSNTYFTVIVQARGAMADELLGSYSHGRMVTVMGRLRPARNSSFKVVVGGIVFGAKAEPYLPDALGSVVATATGADEGVSDTDESDEIVDDDDDFTDPDND